MYAIRSYYDRRIARKESLENFRITSYNVCYTKLLRKAQARIMEILASLRQNQTQLERLQSLAQEFTIKAPKDGMLIYRKNWQGKIGPGSRLSSWDPVVAELPDLSDFISISYINEVDVSKVYGGQPVVVQIDAFPDHVYSGMVVQVANIGERNNFV